MFSRHRRRLVSRLAIGSAFLAAAAGGAQAQTSTLPVPTTPKRTPARVIGPARPEAAAAPASAPIRLAATAPAAPPATPANERAILERANAYFNGLTTLVADFVQTGGDGRRAAGKLYLARPGKLRFEYDAPATLEVVADGSSVAVRDRKLATQDLYPLSQTPLKFLVRDRIDLARDVKITGITADADGVRIALEDSSTLGGTSKITLTFDPAVEALTKWRIVDPQGFQTNVALSNLDRSRRVDNRLFVISYERMLGEDSKR